MRQTDYLLIGILLLTVGFIVWQSYSDDRVLHTFKFDNTAEEYDIRRLSVAGDFNEWNANVDLLTDRNNDQIWTLNKPLKQGKHSYRFVVNETTWIRDRSVDAYGGKYSNSEIYVSPISMPEFTQITPPAGSWIYNELPEHFTVQFEDNVNDLIAIDLKLDGISRAFSRNHKTISMPLPDLSEGEHQWDIIIKAANGDTVQHKQGIWQVNLFNQAPKAHAGYTQIVNKKARVTLNGGQSVDADFEPLTHFHWKQISGSPIDLKNEHSPFPWFVAATPGTFRFRLTVQDSSGARDQDITEVIIRDQETDLTQFHLSPPRIPYPVQKVALVGEFNQWNSGDSYFSFDSLIGQWTVSVDLRPGKYEYKYVVNDTAWIADPANSDSIPDGWQGFNSLVKVPHQYPRSHITGTYDETREQWVFKLISDSTGDLQTRWIGDIQNPKTFPATESSVLRFNKNMAEGSYFFYALPRGQRNDSEHRTLLINHYKNTKWMDFASTPDWADTAVIYEASVRKISGGTFLAVQKEIPYFKTMGINTLWLMPVYNGPTDHGYAPVSLFNTEADYGTLEAYRKLIETAHHNGIKVLFDFIANHLSDQHLYVKAAADNTGSPLRRWFFWQENDMWGYHNNWDTLVNLNFNEPQVRTHILNSARFWLGMGVDGFRCDVAWAVPHDFWKDFRREIKQINPECVLINEVLPRNPQYHADEFDMSYDTDFYGTLLDVMNGRKPISGLERSLRKTEQNYPPEAQVLRYLENHDLERFIRQFGAKRTRLSAALLFTMPGTPMLYYGQEDACRDMRPAFDPSAKAKWFDFYKSLIILRKTHPVVKFGELQTVMLNDEKKVWHYRRIQGSDTLNVVLNFSEDRQEVKSLINASKILLGKNNIEERQGKRYIKPLQFVFFE